jgi:hypothetical protein
VFLRNVGDCPNCTAAQFNVVGAVREPTCLLVHLNLHVDPRLRSLVSGQPHVSVISRRDSRVSPPPRVGAASCLRRLVSEQPHVSVASFRGSRVSPSPRVEAAVCLRRLASGQPHVSFTLGVPPNCRKPRVPRCSCVYSAQACRSDVPRK